MVNTGLILSFVKRAGLAAYAEKRNLLSENDRERPADIFIPVWGRGGESACLDVRIASTFSQKGLEQVAWGSEAKEGVASSVAEAAEWEKTDKYGAKCRREGYLFIPLVCESTGGLGQGLVNFFRDLADRIVAHAGGVRALVLSDLIGDFSHRLAKLLGEAFNSLYSS